MLCNKMDTDENNIVETNTVVTKTVVTKTRTIVNFFKQFLQFLNSYL